MIPRLITPLLHRQLSRYPAVALLGARQAGLTTLARTLGGYYCNLSNPQERQRLDIEWDERVATDQLLILDEIGNTPELIARLRSVIEQNPQRKGRFLLVGSMQPADLTTGRAPIDHMGTCQLTPLLASELSVEQWDPHWQTGGYPGGTQAFPNWQQDYLSLMAQGELPDRGLTARPTVTERLFRMLAALHGQPWNASQVGKSLGISYHTANSYVDFLERSYLIRRLPAYTANTRKRLVKSAKVYWRDSGLLHALLGLNGDLRDQPWVGASWEGWIIEQILGHLQSTGQPHQAHYLRTSDQKEIDLVLEYRGELWALEIKLTSAPDLNDLKRLADTARLINADRIALISRTRDPLPGAKAASLNLAILLDELTPT